MIRHSAKSAAAALCAALLASQAASAAVEYIVTDLGVFPGGKRSWAITLNNAGQVIGMDDVPGGSFLYSEGTLIDIGSLSTQYHGSRASALNESGQVTGISPTDSLFDSGFLYTGGTMISLGGLDPSQTYKYSEGTALNDAGQVVGGASSPSGHFHAFLYSNGTMTDLDVLPGDTESGALGINTSGQIFGYSSVVNGNMHGFLYASGQLTSLGTLGGPFSFPTAMNQAGQIVGRSAISTGDMHAFLYFGGQMTDLGTLGGTYSEAIAINDAGQIAGNSSTAGGHPHGFLYANGKITDIGVLKTGPRFNYTRVTAMNNAGQIIGVSSVGLLPSGDPHTHPFIYSRGRMTDLLTVLDSNWNIDAVGINDVGQIAATGSTKGIASHALLLTPVRLAPKLSSVGGTSRATENAHLVIRGRTKGHVSSVTYRIGAQKRLHKAAGAHAWRFAVHLHPGTNVFTVQAHGVRGNSKPLRITVVRS
jgi:probable HAF family extracellular repeat protein